jgi:hypothetical protein
LYHFWVWKLNTSIYTFQEKSFSVYEQEREEWFHIVVGETLHLQRIVKMDVTSLLNANSLAAGQQKKEVSRTPPRNRTPWDAGGYSLPINTLSSSTPTTPPQIIHYDDSHVETPRSPHHKFSDSRSSLSSFTSSLHSATHSRFSSMSTVSSTIQPMNSILAESIAVDLATKSQSLDLESAPLPTEQIRSSGSATEPRDSTSPTGSLDTLALVAEDRQARRQSEPSTLKAEEDAMSSSQEVDGKALADKSMFLERPSSPSDAILIKRTTIPTLRVNTGEQDLADPGQLQP